MSRANPPPVYCWSPHHKWAEYRDNINPHSIFNSFKSKHSVVTRSFHCYVIQSYLMTLWGSIDTWDYFVNGISILILCKQFS